MCQTVFRAYSYLKARTGPTKKERSEKLFYGDYSYELAKVRMEDAIKALERDNLVKQLRAARKSQHTSIGGWATAVMALFR
jgi:hypothetical protein